MAFRVNGVKLLLITNLVPAFFASLYKLLFKALPLRYTLFSSLVDEINGGDRSEEKEAFLLASTNAYSESDFSNLVNHRSYKIQEIRAFS